MQLEVGQIYEGIVKGITQYGAFVEVTCEGEPKVVTGMVHISEITNSFVKDIHDYLSENDTVKVKVIGVTPQGKISMSIKQAAAGEEQAQEQRQKKRREAPKPRVWEPKRSVPQSEMTFEDMLLRFKQHSEENICDLKRGSERKGGSRSRK